MRVTCALERRRVALGPCGDVDLGELRGGQLGSWGLRELLQAFSERDVAHADDLQNLLLRAMEPVHLGGDHQRRAADARGAASQLDPVAAHPLDDAHGGIVHLVGFLLELQLAHEAPDEQLGLDDGEVLVEDAAELQVRVAQLVDVAVAQRVGEIDQQAGGFLLAAHHVQACASDGGQSPALREVALCRQPKPPDGAFNMAFR